MNINKQIPRTHTGVSEKHMPVTTYLRDTFFPGVDTFHTAKVEMDIRKGGYIVAPFVAPLVNGIVMDREGFTTKEYEPPMIAPKRVLNPKLLETTLPGENTYSLKTPEERQQFYIQRDLQEMNDSIDRREELMIAQLLTTGKIQVRGYYGEDLSKFVDNEIDYGFTQKDVLSGGNKWDQSTSKKYADLKRGVTAVRKAGYNPKDIVLGDKAWELLQADEDFIEKLDARRIELGTIAPEVRTQNGNGLVYLGDLTELGVQLWVYYAWYKDMAGVVQRFIPDDHVLILPGEIGDIAYGAVTYLKQISFDDGVYVTVEGSRIPRTLINTNSGVKEMLLQSKPIPRPFDLDSWYVLDVV